jgi:hypothetical protein
MHLSGTAAVVRHQAGPVSPGITGENGAPLNLSSTERAAVGAELARLTVKVAHLAARLDRLHTALVAPAHQSSQPASTPPWSQAAPSLVTASWAPPWR